MAGSRRPSGRAPFLTLEAPSIWVQSSRAGPASRGGVLGVRLITADDVRQLAEVDARPHTMVSLYLNVDGREYPRPGDFLPHLDALLRRARALGGADADITKIGDYARSRFDRHETRGLALFSCARAGFWAALALPQPVRHRVDVQPTAVIRPL